MQRDQHTFTLQTTWTGNRGYGTESYRSYDRNYELQADGKSAVILGSSDPAFRGDASRYNPEELLIGSLSACHMLWFLHLCSEARVIVTAYHDAADGTLHINGDGSGEFTEVVLHPAVEITDPSIAYRLPELHERAHEKCFIARSVNFPVRCEPRT